jgi:hypothetical protein
MAPRLTKRPKKRTFSKSEDEDFERVSRHELERMATRDWDAMTAFWPMLPRALPSTRRRLLCHCLQLCCERGDPPPAKLVASFRQEIERPARARIHDPKKMEDAARYLADHPKCSLSEIARSIGLFPKNKTTIRDYMRHPKFWRECNDQLVRSRKPGGTEAELRKRLVQTKNE